MNYTAQELRDIVDAILARENGNPVEHRLFGGSASNKDWSPCLGTILVREYDTSKWLYRPALYTKLRPWLIEEIPVGKVVRRTVNGIQERLMIVGVFGETVMITTGTVYSRSRMLSEFTMDDGSPCGVQE